MTDIEERLRQLAREIGGPDDSATAAARRRVDAALADAASRVEPNGAPSRPQPRPRPRRRIGRRRGLLVFAGAVVVGGASAVAISSLGHSGAAAPAACQVFADRGAGPQKLNFYAPATGVSDSGDAVITWVARGGRVQAVTRVGSGGWSIPRAVSPQLATDILPRSVSLATGGDGGVLLGWTSKATQVIEWSPASGWAAVRTLSVPGVRTAPYEPPQLAVNDAGDAAALWSVSHHVSYFRGGGASIGDPFPAVARREPDGTWRVVTTLDQAQGKGPRFTGAGRGAGWGFAPQMTLGDDGTTTLVGSGNFPGIAFERLSATGARLAGGAADAKQSYNATATAIDGNGNVLALWMRGTNLVGGVLPAGGDTWKVRVIANTGLYSADFSLAANRTGDAVVAFRARARGVRGPRFPSRAPTARRDRDIQAISYSATTGGWTRPTRLSTRDMAAADARVAIDAAGRATVAWVQGPNNGQGVTRVMIAQGSSGRWAAPQAISGPASDPVAPALAVAGDGRALAAWTGCRGAGAAVYVSEKAGAEWSEPKVVG